MAEMEDGCRRPGVGKDWISGLPDELLHDILRCLRSAPAAARTSVLAHRWRRVWARAPDLVFGDDLIRGVEGDGSSFLDAVDGALAAYSDDPAVHLDSLKITVPGRCGENVPARRVASWLRFASRRLAGTFYLSVPYQRKPWPRVNREDDELELPPCEGATKIVLQLGSGYLHRILPAGTFAALADLEIHLATMEGRELEILVSSQCPQLRNLTLAVNLLAASDIAVRSATLLSLKFHVRNTRRLDIAAPMLEILDVSSGFFAHAFEPFLLHLLSNAKTIRKLLLYFAFPSLDPHCSLDCPCRLPQSPMANKIILDSLEEIEIHVGGSADEVDKFVELLQQLLSNIWSTATLVKLKSVEMNKLCHVSPLSDELCKKICGMCPPSIRIKSNVFPEGFAQD